MSVGGGQNPTLATPAEQPRLRADLRVPASVLATATGQHPAATPTKAASHHPVAEDLVPRRRANAGAGRGASRAAHNRASGGDYSTFRSVREGDTGSRDGAPPAIVGGAGAIVAEPSTLLETRWQAASSSDLDDPLEAINSYLVELGETANLLASEASASEAAAGLTQVSTPSRSPPDDSPQVRVLGRVLGIEWKWFRSGCNVHTGPGYVGEKRGCYLDGSMRFWREL